MAKYSIRTVKEKEAIVKHYQQHGWLKTMKKFRVPRATLVHWVGRVKNASPDEKNPLGRRYMIRKDTVNFIHQLLKKQPDLSIAETREICCEKQQQISRTTVWHIMQRDKKHYE